MFNKKINNNNKFRTTQNCYFSMFINSNINSYSFYDLRILMKNMPLMLHFFFLEICTIFSEHLAPTYFVPNDNKDFMPLTFEKIKYFAILFNGK